MKNLWTNTLRKSIIIILSLTVVALPFSLPRYWEFSSSSQLWTNLPRGITREGNPWIGAENPVLTVSIFSDYQCFQCYKMHVLLMNLTARFPQKLQLVHIHFPLDHKYNPAVTPQPYHIGSGELALLAIEAAAQGKFWETNEELFAAARTKKELNIIQLAEKCRLDRKKMIMAISNPKNIIQLRRDMKKGIELKVNSTPSFLINDTIYQGTIPSTILNTLE